MSAKPISFNISINLFQTLFATISTFLAFKITLGYTEISKFGVWSLIMSYIGFIRFIDAGLTAPITVFISEYLSKKDFKRIQEVLDTSFALLAFCYIPLLLSYGLLLKYLYTKLLEGNELILALEMLAYLLVYCYFSILSLISVGVFEAYRRYDLKAYLYCFSYVLYVSSILVLVPSYGIMGLVFSQIILSLSTFLGGRILMRNLVSRTDKKFRFNIQSIKGMLAYSGHLQFATLSNVLIEPFIKTLIVRFSGLALLGIYEIVMQMIFRLRSILASVNHPMIPDISNKLANTKAQYDTYKRFAELSFFLTTYLYFCFIATSSYIAEIFLGNKNFTEFILICLILILPSWLNTLAITPYYLNLGKKQAIKNTFYHFYQILITFSLSSLIGIFYGGIGVLIGYSLALTISSIILFKSIKFPQHSKFNLYLQILRRNILGLIFFSLSYFLYILYSIEDAIIYSLILLFIYHLSLIFIARYQYPGLLNKYIFRK